MDAEISEKLASSLAVYAVRGDRTALEKCALGEGLAESLRNVRNQAGTALQGVYGTAQPYLADPRVRNALLGVGAGGLAGLLQPKRKMRNALTYGLLGGIGGAGLTQAYTEAFGRGRSPAAGTPPANGKPPVSVRVSNSPYPITPEGRARAIEELKNSDLNPVRGGQLGAAGAAAAGAMATNKYVNKIVTRNAVNKDWAANAPQYLYELANGDGKTLPNGAQAPLTQEARVNIIGQGKSGQPFYIEPSVGINPRTGKSIVLNNARFNAARTQMTGRAQPSAQQLLRGRVAGGAAGLGAGIVTGLAGRNLGEAIWNFVNRQKFPSAY